MVVVVVVEIYSLGTWSITLSTYLFIACFVPALQDEKLPGIALVAFSCS